MELLLFRHDEFRRLYNCSYNINSIPVEDRTHPIIGYALILATVAYEIAYVPCMFVFWRHMRHSSCYKIMFFLGVVDVVNMVFVGGFTAVCAIWGLVYCSAPALMYFVGTVAPLFWYLEASTALLLAVDTEGKFLVPAHTYHNFGLPMAMLALYHVVCTMIAVRLHKNRMFIGSESTAIPRVSRMSLFAQVLVISVINTVYAVVYDLMIERFIEPTFFLSVFCTFGWLNGHGSPGIVYLLMNRTVREECKRFFAWRWVKTKIARRTASIGATGNVVQLVIVRLESSPFVRLFPVKYAHKSRFHA